MRLVGNHRPETLHNIDNHYRQQRKNYYGKKYRNI